MYSKKRSGPKIESWGKPHVMKAEDDVQFPKLTEEILSFSYEVKQFNTGP